MLLGQPVLEYVGSLLKHGHHFRLKIRVRMGREVTQVLVLVKQAFQVTLMRT